MSSLIYPTGAIEAAYRGLPSIYEFINSDGEYRKFNCGQAAACTMLTYCKALPESQQEEAARLSMTTIEHLHPPDNMGGWFGTSRRRVERILRSHDISFEAIHGEEALRQALSVGRPVIVMVGTEGPKIWKWHAPSGHWIVLYGYDDERVYCTNWNGSGIPWEEFRRRWKGVVPRVISMRNIGLVPTTQTKSAEPSPFAVA